MIDMLPAPVAAYFTAANSGDADAVARCFVVTAEVNDEGESHLGRGAIRAWAQSVHMRYQPCATALSVTEEEGDILVVVSVAGSFPSSPITLHYAFGLDGDAIGWLAIGVSG